MDNINIKSGIILENEVWTGNILVADDVIIPKGVNVVVKPNTNIKFQKKSKNKLFNKNYKLDYLFEKFNLYSKTYADKISIIVYGSFIVVGNKKEIINIGNDGWDGLIYSAPKAVLKLKYCSIRYAFGILCDVNSKLPVIDSCIIEQCYLGIVAFSKIIIKNSRINYNEIGVVCYNKFVIANNQIIDNFIKGVDIISKVGYLYKNESSLNNTGTEIFKSSGIKVKDEQYKRNNIGVSINQSNNIQVNVVSANNFFNIYVYNHSYDIDISSYIINYTGIQITDLSETRIKDSSFWVTHYSVVLCSFALANIENINICNSHVGFLLFDCSFVLMKKSNVDVDKRFLIAHAGTNFLDFDSRFSSTTNGLLILGFYIQAYLRNSHLFVKDSCGDIKGNSEIYFEKSKLKAYSFFKMTDATVFNITESVLEAKTGNFTLRDEAKLNIFSSIVKTENDFIFNLYKNSKINIISSNILSLNGSFSRLLQRSHMGTEGSKISVNELLCETMDLSEFSVKNSFFKNKKGCFINSRNFSNICLYGLKVKAQEGISSYDNSKVILKKSSLFVLKDFIKTDGNSQIFVIDNHIRLFDGYIKSFFDSKIYLDSVLFIKNIRIDGDSDINLKFNNSKFVSIGTISFNLNNYYSPIILDNLNVRSKKFFIDNNIGNNKNKTVIINNSQINSEVEFITDNDINIYNTNITTLISNRNNFCLSILNTKIEKSFIYGQGEIEIEGSEIGGEIEVEGIGRCRVAGSEVTGEIRSKDIGEVEIEGSKVKGARIEIEKGSGIRVKESEIDLNEEIIIEGKADLEKTVIYATGGVSKRNFDNFVCKNVKIKSIKNCLNFSGNFDVFCSDVELSSKTGYSFIATNNKNIKFDNLTISSNSGFLCNNANCDIVKLDADIFVNFLSITNTNCSITKSNISYKIPKNFILSYGLSDLNLTDATIDFNDNIMFLQYLKDCSLITLKQNSNLRIDGLKTTIDKNNTCSFLESDGNSNFTISKSSIANFYDFAKMNMSSNGTINNSVVDVISAIAEVNQYAELISLSTIFMNKFGYKFVLKDMGNFYLYSSKILKNQFLSMKMFSQTYMIKNDLQLSGESCRIGGFSTLDDCSSKFLIKDDLCKRYAFYLQNIGKLNLNSTEIKTNKHLFSIMDKSKLTIKDSDIRADNKGILMFVRNKGVVNILKSNINAFSFAKLKKYANMIIDKTRIYTKSYGLKLLGNSKVSIKNSEFGNKNFSKKDIAFEIVNNSLFELTNSSVDNFKIGLKYDNNENVVVKNSQIDCEDDIVFTNDKRYLSVDNPVQRKILYKLQHFVLSTNNIFLLNKIYRFVYSISIYIYSFYVSKKYLVGLYLRRGMLNNFIAGSSDIDYLTILKNSNLDDEYKQIFNIKANYKKIKNIFPFYGENLIMNKQELLFYIKHGGMRKINLKDSKCLYGDKTIISKEYQNDKKDVIDKINICSEILNSYILLNNNFFYNVDVVSDICFAKATVDILRNIEYFYDGKEPVSRFDFLKGKIKKDDRNIEIFKSLYTILKEIKRTDKENRILIFDYVFKKLEELSIKFVKEMLSNKYVEKYKISSEDTLSAYKETKVLEKDIDMIILDSPGLCYLVLKEIVDINKLFFMHDKIKEKHNVYNTPILFFTKNMFQMLICSNFKNNPIDYYKICNIEEQYRSRKIYLNYDYECFYNKKEIMKQQILTSLSQTAIQINEIDITKDFKDIKYVLFENLLRIIKFYLCLKNDKITENKSYSDIINAFEKKENFKEFQNIMLLFENNNDLSDEIKTNRIVVFIKQIQRELIRDYE